MGDGGSKSFSFESKKKALKRLEINGNYVLTTAKETDFHRNIFNVGLNKE